MKNGTILFDDIADDLEKDRIGRMIGVVVGLLLENNEFTSNMLMGLRATPTFFDKQQDTDQCLRVDAKMWLEIEDGEPIIQVEAGLVTYYPTERAYFEAVAQFEAENNPATTIYGDQNDNPENFLNSLIPPQHE